MEKLANGLIKVSSFLYNKEEAYSLNLNTGWVRDLLEKLENELILVPEKVPGERTFTFDFNLKKIKDNQLSDYFILKGNLSVQYYCSCIRCLEPTLKSVNLAVNCCFLSNEFEESDLIDSDGMILLENEEFDTFFYQKGYLDLKEFLNEILVMNMDPLPLHDENCKGLCPQCGINLNESSCPHISR